MEYTLEMAEKIAERLRALPPMDAAKRRLNKQEVVKHLAQEIKALQERGYSLDQIADSLRGHGFEITTPTLKSYLQRTKDRSRTKRRTPAAPSATPPTPARTPPQAPRETAQNIRPSPPEKAAKSTRSEFITADRQKL